MSIYDHFYPAPTHQAFTLEGERGAVLLIHGFTGSPAELRPIAETLNECGWHVEVPRLPGYGDQIRDLIRYNRFDWLAHVREKWAALQNFETRVLMGHSMGASLAIQLAAESPPDQLILIAPFWKANPLTFQARFADRLVPLLKYIIPYRKLYRYANFADLPLRNNLGLKAPSLNLDDPATQERLRHEYLLPLKGFDELFKVGKSAYQLAPRISAPTLVIQGTQDKVTTPENTRLLIQKFKGQVTLKEFDDGHELILPFSPNAQAIAQVIADYLEH